MWKTLFPEQGWYLYINSAQSDDIQIKGPFTRAYANRTCLSILGVFGVTVRSKHHWKRPDGASELTEEEQKAMAWFQEMTNL